MDDTVLATVDWLAEWMAQHDIELWGIADLRGLEAPRDEAGERYPRGIGLVYRMRTETMTRVSHGPNRAYVDEYIFANRLIDGWCTSLAMELQARGFRAMPLAASERTHTRSIRGLFPHKTVATRAGLGWVGRNCQLVTYQYGPWVRLGTVFTDMALPCGTPLERGLCGDCVRCVEACPAGALSGALWHAGLEREHVLDASICDSWKREHFRDYLEGRVCGICTSVCPYGRRSG